MQSNICFIRHGWIVLSKDSCITCLFMFKQYCQWNWYNTMKSSICFKYEACLQPMRIETWYQYLFKIFLNQHMLCILSLKVMFELIPKHRSAVTSDQHVLIINNSPIEYGHSLLVPSINSCLPQVFALNDFLMNWFLFCLFISLCPCGQIIGEIYFKCIIHSIAKSVTVTADAVTATFTQITNKNDYKRSETEKYSHCR